MTTRQGANKPSNVVAMAAYHRGMTSEDARERARADLLAGNKTGAEWWYEMVRHIMVLEETDRRRQ